MTSRFFLILSVLALSVGCASAKFKNVREDSYAQPFGFAGATFLCEGGSCQDGIYRSERFCQDRKMHIVDEKSQSFVDTMYLPVTNTTNHSGQVSSYSSGNSYSYTGTSTQTNYVPMNYTRTIREVDFICADKDAFEKVFTLYSGSLEMPLICTTVPQDYAPGAERLWRLAHEGNNEDCLSKQGWLRYVSAQGDRKLLLFVGSKGQSICKKLEQDLATAELAGSKAAFYLQKNVNCGK